MLLPFLKLIRLPNLLIIVLTQYMMRHCIIAPMVGIYGFELRIGEFDFFLLVLSTVLIAAAGYAINDYFDLKIDRVNKPDKIIVSRVIKRRVVMGAHVLMNGLGLLIGIYISYRLGLWKLSVIHVFAVTSLWFYSTSFQHQVLVGNFIISLLAGLIPLIVGLYEISLQNLTNAAALNELGINLNFIAYWILGYAGFAFLLTMAREITKDMADIEGDQKYGCRTVPIKWGMQNAKYTVIGLYLITMTGIVYIQQTYLNDPVSLTYMVVTLIIPALFAMYLTYQANERKAFLRASNINKLIALMGILYAAVVCWKVALELAS